MIETPTTATPAVVQALIEVLGRPRVITGAQIAQRITSHWDASPTTALALIKPRSTQEVSAALTICHQFKQPIVTQGGLTGCVAGAVAGPQEVILSLENMNRIENIEPSDGTATVQAGVVLEVLQEAAKQQNLLFPLDLGARGSCTIGGNIATNAGGINVLRYGMMRNLVLGLEVVTADGTVISSMNAMLKNNAGYDLKQLFIGSEGTLGIVTRAVVKLFPRLLSSNTALLATDSFAAVTALLKSLQSDLAGTLSAYEVMWGSYFDGVTAAGGHQAPMTRGHSYYIVIEAEGVAPQADRERFLQTLETALTGGLIQDAILPESETQRREIWKIRENFEPILPAYLYDVSLPTSAMEGYISQVNEGLKKRWPESQCYVLGHIADGNLHLFVQPGIDGDLHAACDELVYSPLQGLEGSVSAEHGIGTEKLHWLRSSRSAQEIAVMGLLKQSMDPMGLLNPGRVLELSA
jgi:FAD/FMN-containing dehydrogenase